MFNITNIDVNKKEKVVNFDLLLDEGVSFIIHADRINLHRDGVDKYFCNLGTYHTKKTLLIPILNSSADMKLCGFYLTMSEDIDVDNGCIKIKDCNFYEFESFETFLKSMKERFNERVVTEKRINDLNGKSLMI